MFKICVKCKKGQIASHILIAENLWLCWNCFYKLRKTKNLWQELKKILENAKTNK